MPNRIVAIPSRNDEVPLGEKPLQSVLWGNWRRFLFLQWYLPPPCPTTPNMYEMFRAAQRQGVPGGPLKKEMCMGCSVRHTWGQLAKGAVRQKGGDFVRRGVGAIPPLQNKKRKRRQYLYS